MDNDKWYDSGDAETLPDIEITLPQNNLHVIVSRVKENDSYITRIWFNRKVRRHYVIGLLTEAISMCNKTNAEFIWTDDTPCILEENINNEVDNNEFDDDDDDDYAVNRR